MGLPELGSAVKSLGFSATRNWRLRCIEEGSSEVFEGQFIAKELTENTSTNFAITSTLGSVVPGIHFTNVDAETLTFKGRIFRSSPVAGAAFQAISNPVGALGSALSGEPLVGNGSVKESIDKLKLLNKPDENLARPKRYMFTYGSEIQFEVFVKEITNIVYDDIRSDGTIRGASFTVTLLKTKSENLAKAAGISPAGLLSTAGGVFSATTRGLFSPTIAGRRLVANVTGGSPHTISKFIAAKEGDTFESIARREYGNPFLGDILRRAQPDLAHEILPNETVAIIKKQEALQIPVTPQAVALRDTVDNRIVIQEFLDLRSSIGVVRI